MQYEVNPETSSTSEVKLSSVTLDFNEANVSYWGWQWELVSQVYNKRHVLNRLSDFAILHLSEPISGRVETFVSQRHELANQKLPEDLQTAITLLSKDTESPLTDFLEKQYESRSDLSGKTETPEFVTLTGEAADIAVEGMRHYIKHASDLDSVSGEGIFDLKRAVDNVAAIEQVRQDLIQSAMHAVYETTGSKHS